MKNSFNMIEKTLVDPEEILFFQKNAPASFVTLIKDRLEEKGIILNRTQILREVSSIKKDYLKPVIEEARFLIKAIKGATFKENE